MRHIGELGRSGFGEEDWACLSAQRKWPREVLAWSRAGLITYRYLVMRLALMPVQFACPASRLRPRACRRRRSGQVVATGGVWLLRASVGVISFSGAAACSAAGRRLPSLECLRYCDAVRGLVCRATG